MIKKHLLIIIAFSFFIVGSLKMMHWHIFWQLNEAIRKRDYSEFIKKYRSDVAIIIPSYPQMPLLLEIVSFFLFVIAGIIFLNQKEKKGFTILGYVALFLASWNLFSLL